MGYSIKDALLEAANSITHFNGFNYIKGKYNTQTKMEGINSTWNDVELAAPTLVFDKRNMDGTPINLHFNIDGDVIKMHYEFRVESKIQDIQPMLVSSVSLVMHVKDQTGKETTENLDYYLSPKQPQAATGFKIWNSIDEFLAVKSAFEKKDNSSVYFTWETKIQWVDISSQKLEDIKKPEYKPQAQIARETGTICIEAVNPGTCTYDSMFGGVKDLLHWDYEILNGRKVYFLDPLKDDAIYFLPQEYRIKALPNNAPDMTTEIISENGEYKVLMHFGIAPYVHPNAKRDAYNIFLRRKGKQYCELRYGGYKSAKFNWDAEMCDGKLYGENGFISITDSGTIDASPDSSFNIIMEAPIDGLIKTFQDKIFEEDVKIGNVVFTVYDGLNEEEKVLDPIDVKLNLHKLSGIKPEVTITDCMWPNYVAKITNTGIYPIEIGEAALSVLHREKNQVKEAKHNLKSNIKWPQTIAKGESITVEISSEQAEKIKHRKFPLFWKINEDYWTDFICEPYHFRLPEESLREVMEKTNENAAYEHKTWDLTFKINFSWLEHPDIAAVQIEIKNKYELDEVVTLTEDGEIPKIPMVPNLNADLKFQQNNEKKFEYRVRTIVKNSPQKPEWSEWTTESGDYLYIYEENLTA